MKQPQFFKAIRAFITANAAEPHEGRKANNLTVIIGGFDLSIEGRGRGTGYVTIRKDYAIIANESPLDFVFDQDECVDAMLAIHKVQREQEAEAVREAFATERAEIGRVFADEPPMRADILDDSRSSYFGMQIALANDSLRRLGDD